MNTMTDLQRAFETLRVRQPLIKKKFDYYDGNQPLKYSATRLNRVFGNRSAKFTQNWCAVVVESVFDRLELTGWDAKEKRLNDALDSLWEELQISLEAQEVHEAALVAGEGFIIAEKADDGTAMVYSNYPGNVVVFYETGNPRKKRYAAKWYYDEPFTRLILYYLDRIEHYFARGKPTEVAAFTSFQEDKESSGENEYGIIPVFHFRTNRRMPKSELDNVFPLQDAINKLLSDMMVTAEFNAFPARYIISNADIESLKNSPNEVWHLPAASADDQPTSVGTLDSANLANYSGQISELANSIAAITHTPKHYFFDSSSSQLSGEALIAMEAPLTKKVSKRRDFFTPIWAELGSYLLLISGYGEVSPKDITPNWKMPESVQPKTQAETRTENVKSGLPLKAALRLEGRSEDEIEQIMQEKEEEQTQNGTVGEAVLNNLLTKTAKQNPQEKNGGK